MKQTATVMLALASLSWSAATAQDFVSHGTTQSGTFQRGAVVCWALPTEAGSRWRVMLEGRDIYLQLGRGSCDQFVQDQHDDSGGLIDVRTRIDFNAGGGIYVIRGSSVFGPPVPYRLRVERLPGFATAGMLPAGSAAGPWLQAGWTPPSVSVQPARNGEGLAPGTIFADCADVCPQLVVIPAGSFTMGSPENEVGRTVHEGPRHPVVFDHDFAIGRYEVTFDEFDACVVAGGCSRRPGDQGWGRGRRPVVDVSWNDAMEYVTWLSEQTGQRYTLPSESEWEYAARAGTSTPWHTGNAVLTDDANILNSFARTVVVGGYPPNAFGLHDVHGNVQEWVLDCVDTGYVGAPNDGSAATNGDCQQQRVVRSGNFDDEPSLVRSAYRTASPQTTRYRGVGFRVARAM